MTLSEYQKLAARTINEKLTKSQQAKHALFGMPAEVGEITGLFQKEMQGHALDLEAVQKEIGDVLWMIAELCTAYEWDLGNIAQMNIDKLRKRYPDGFDEEHSVHRTE